MLASIISSAAGSQSFLLQRIARSSYLAANAPAHLVFFRAASRRCSSSPPDSPPPPPSSGSGSGSGKGKGDGKGDAPPKEDVVKNEQPPEGSTEEAVTDTAVVKSESAPPPAEKTKGEGGSREGGGRGRRPSLFQRILKASGGDKNKANQEAEVEAASGKEAKDGSAEETPQRAIVPAGPKPENFPKVLALPLTRRPLFPGFYAPIHIKDPKLADSLIELRARGTPYVGAFLLKSAESAKEESPKEEEAGGEKSTEKEVTKDADLKGEPLYKRLHEYGTFAQVLNVIRSVDSDGPAQVFLMGHRRLRLTGMVSDDPLTVSVEHLKDRSYDEASDIVKATFMEVVASLRDLMRYNPLYKETIQVFVQNMGNSHINAARLADFGSALTTADEPLLQEVLEQLDVEKRLTLALTLLKKELELAKLQASIAKSVEEKITGDQRRFFLMEQLKAIKKELGLEADDKTALTLKFKERLEPNRKGCPEHVLQVIDEELQKLQGLESSSSEFNVTRNYLDWLTCLPWGHYSKENFDVREAQRILDEDHYGLTDVKERILEFIAVGKLRGTAVGKIICLSGPPGVGKTSIGKSIAKALNRKFFRFSVGGLSDVAEIKGHRRTYVGAMPGKMVQCLKTTGTANPLVLIDEIDKLGRGHAGDPASALLELLDPEQNANFLDHYLDVAIDLTKVLFVCTANLVENIPAPLLDRMEVIRLVGYITDEKMHIARDYLEKQARETSGIKDGQVELTDAALHSLIETYCREAGVRNLQKHIDKIYRKIALKLVRKELESSGAAESAAQTDASQADTPPAEVIKHVIEAPAVQLKAQVEEVKREEILEKVVVKKVASMGGDEVLEVELAEVEAAEIAKGATDTVVVKLEDDVKTELLADKLVSETAATTKLSGDNEEEDEPADDLPAEIYESDHPCFRVAPEAIEERLKIAAAARLADVAAKRAAKLAAASDGGGKASAATDESSGETPAASSEKAAASQEERKEDEVKPVEKIIVDQPNLHEYVGIPVFQSDRLYEQTPVGVVMGLAWTAMGGSTLYVETSLIEQGENKASLQLTGQLGDVMKESGSIAHTVARNLLREIEPENQFFANSKLHLHVPAGATPKDGPSAGCTMITSMISLALNKPVKKDVAMTGEVTLTGRVLPIGGVKEKTVASRRSGVKEIIFPAGNKRDFEEILPHVKEGMVAHFVETYHQIFDIVFPKGEDKNAGATSGTSTPVTADAAVQDANKQVQ